MQNENSVNIIGPTVQRLREERGWSLQRLADEFDRQGISVTPQTLERVESQEEIITDAELMAFALIFQTDIDDLLPPNVTSPKNLKRLAEMEERVSIARGQPQGFVWASLNRPKQTTR